VFGTSGRHRGKAELMSEGLRAQGKRRSVALTIATLLLGASLAACGEDKPAVCGSADDLKASVDDVKDVDLSSSNAFSDLQSGLTSIESDLADVKADAKSEFSSQIQAVQQSFDALKTSADAAKADPTAATLSAAGAALSAFGSGVETLVSDIQSTC
jgi:hypothetical protein